jgi:arsenite methyltransferase
MIGCEPDLDRGSGRLEAAVCEAYSAAAQKPSGDHPFPVGRDFAASVGYPGELLDRLPSAAVEAFSGVSNVSLFASISVGAMVLDLGCGAGLDSLIAAGRVGSDGLIVGVDFSRAMLARAALAASEARMSNISFCLAQAASLPLKDGTVDVALVNGIFNLNPSRDAIFKELARVVRRGGAVFAAELVLREALPAQVCASAESWFA